MSQFFFILLLLAILLLIFVPSRALYKRRHQQATAFIGLSTSKWLLGLAAAVVISLIGAGATASAQTTPAKHFPVIAQITTLQKNRLSKQETGAAQNASDLSNQYSLAKSTSKSLSAEEASLEAIQNSASTASSSEASSKTAAEAASKQAAADQSSRQAAEQAAAASRSRSVAAATPAPATNTGGGNQGDLNTASAGQIVGNANSKIYHVPGQAGYHMNSSNAVYFANEAAAQAAGYRKALR